MNYLDGKAVIGNPVLEWDNHNTYAPGEIVYFSQQHWRALRDVMPPLVPAFMDGDVPGKSDAWAPISAHDTYGGHVMGAPVLGLVDGVTDWNKSVGYNPGAVVRYWGSYYKAQYSISPSWWGNAPPDEDNSWVMVPAMSVLGEEESLDDFNLDDIGDPVVDNDYDPEASAILTEGGFVIGDVVTEVENLIADDDDTVFDGSSGTTEITGDGYGYLHGCDILGEDIGDSGFDINGIEKIIRGVKPLSAAAGQKFMGYGISALTMANMHDSGHPGATARRSDLIRQLDNMRTTLAQSKIDPIPENADPSKSPAEILRNAVVAAIIEYNAVAQENDDMETARSKFYSDIADNAKNLAISAYNKGKGFVDDVAWYAKATTWAVIGGVLLVGLGGYKLLSSQSASSLFGGYLGARR